ncbi:MAG: hypothetical protein IJ770_00500 [Alphaproteobacteria bacterium]|nr:hypothetical protein [Alphaproteobacteria bacterium]
MKEKHYRPDGTLEYIDYGHKQAYYHSNGMRSHTVHDDGFTDYYGDFGIRVHQEFRKNNGDIIHINMEGDKCLNSWIEDKDGNRYDRDRIKDNILAYKRRHYAEKFGLENVKTPKFFRQFEAYVAQKMFNKSR